MKGDLDIVAGKLTAGGGRRQGGFTLVELMVVVLIICLLLAILAPAAATAFQLVERSISRSYMHIIEGGLGMYWTDFKDYPPSTGYGRRGSEIIAVLLTGYAGDAGLDGKPTGVTSDDGKVDFGFRLIEKGKIYGPYNGTEALPMTGSPRCFIDRFDNPILYYRFDEENSEYVRGHDTRGPADINAYAKSGQRYVRTDFLLISRGPDDNWAPGPDGVLGTDDDEELDDITNLEAK